MANGLRIARCSTCFCNIIFVLTSLLMLYIGIVIQFHYSHYRSFVSIDFWTIPSALILVGIVLFLISCLGYWGALKQINCLVLIFAISLFILVVFEIVFCVAAYIKHIDIPEIIKEQVNSTIIHYNEREDYRDAWSLMQTELECCGAYDANDWEEVTGNTTLPVSCCTVIVLNEADSCTTAHAHSQGCLDKLLSIFNSDSIILPSIVLGVISVQVLTIMFACCLYH